jgi:hypothetical protein
MNEFLRARPVNFTLTKIVREHSIPKTIDAHDVLAILKHFGSADVERVTAKRR